jgi:hypothetical protein
MARTLARVEVALVLSMARAANGYAQASMRYARSVGERTLGCAHPYRLDRSHLDQFSLDGYRAYLREIAAITRGSAITFVDLLERLSND